MRQTIAAFLVGLSITFLIGAAWNGTFEGQPTGAELASTLDEFINELKIETRQRMEVEHYFGGSTDDNGLHALGSARCFQQNGAPADIQGGTAALGQYNSAAGVDAGTPLQTEEVGASTDDIGKGRCWIDLDGPDNVAGTPDDRSLATWDETNNRWVYQGAADPTVVEASQRFMYDPGKVNLLDNGSFEPTDGTGALAATAVPQGWTAQGTPTHAYTASPAAQGDGVFYQVTAGADNSGINQTLTSLKASTTYYVSGLAQPVAGGDSCTIRTTGASVNAASVIAAGTAWTKLGSTFTTDGTPTNVVVIAEADVNGDICRFDYLGVYELTSDRRPVAPPAGTICWDQDATVATNYGGGVMVGVPGLSCTVTTPGDNFATVVDANITADNEDGGTRGIEVELLENCGGGAAAVASNFATMGPDAATTNDITTVSLHWVKRASVPAETCTYTLQGASDGGTVLSNDQDNDSNSSLALPFSSLSVELKPLR